MGKEKVAIILGCHIFVHKISICIAILVVASKLSYNAILITSLINYVNKGQTK